MDDKRYNWSVWTLQHYFDQVIEVILGFSAANHLHNQWYSFLFSKTFTSPNLYTQYRESNTVLTNSDILTIVLVPLSFLFLIEANLSMFSDSTVVLLSVWPVKIQWWTLMALILRIWLACTEPTWMCRDFFFPLYLVEWFCILSPMVDDNHQASNNHVFKNLDVNFCILHVCYLSSVYSNNTAWSVHQCTDIVCSCWHWKKTNCVELVSSFSAHSLLC